MSRTIVQLQSTDALEALILQFFSDRFLHYVNLFVANIISNFLVGKPFKYICFANILTILQLQYSYNFPFLEVLEAVRHDVAS